MEITAALALTVIGDDCFEARNFWMPTGAKGAFGGSIFSQGAYAAAQTVSDRHILHSLHAYFLRPVQNIPTVYRVERTRDDRNYVTRTVRAFQQNETLVFLCLASFRLPEESTLEHQVSMPDVPPPEDLTSDEGDSFRLFTRPDLGFDPSKLSDHTEPYSFEVRPVQPWRNNKFIGFRDEAKSMISWVRARGEVPDDVKFHQSALTYASDLRVGLAAAFHHPIAYGRDPGIELLTSLDHAVWFHDAFRVDDWLLFVFESSRASKGRAMITGRFFARDGRHVATMTQEAALRATRRMPAKRLNAMQPRI